MNKIALLTAPGILLSQAAAAVCPLCTAAVAIGLEGARRMGVDDMILGVWAGAFAMAVIFLIAKKMYKWGVENAIWYALLPVGVFGFLIFLQSISSVNFGENLLFGMIDKFYTGVVSGAITLYAAEKWNMKLRQKNGGKSYFKFQKVLLPLGALLLISGIFAAVVYL